MISTADADQWRPFFDALLHCHSAKRVRKSDGRFVVTGDPTEVALLEFAIEHGLANRLPLRCMGKLAFDADWKRISTLHWSEGRLVAFTKDAPESVLALCTHTQSHGNIITMSPSERTPLEPESVLRGTGLSRVGRRHARRGPSARAY